MPLHPCDLPVPSDATAGHWLRKSVGPGPGQHPPLPSLESWGCTQFRASRMFPSSPEGCPHGTGPLGGHWGLEPGVASEEATSGML